MVTDHSRSLCHLQPKGAFELVAVPSVMAVVAAFMSGNFPYLNDHDTVTGHCEASRNFDSPFGAPLTQSDISPYDKRGADQDAIGHALRRP
jgi:hypothetical protein